MTAEPTELSGRASPSIILSVKRRLLRGSVWTLSGRVVTMALSLIINAMLARLLPPEELGAYFTTFTLVFLGSVIAQLGLDRAVVRFVSAGLATGQSGLAREAIRKVLIFGALGAVGIGLALTLGLGSWLAEHVYRSQIVEQVIPLAAGWLIATALQSLLVETFRGLQRFDLATVLDQLFVDVLTASALAALLLLRAHPSVGDVVALWAGATALGAVIAGVLLLKRLRRLHGDGRVERGQLFSVAWPILIINVATVLLGSGIDLWVLGAFRTQADVAAYGAASRLVVLVATPFLILQAVTPPLIVELYAQGKKQQLEKSLRAVATLAGLPAFAGMLVFILFGRQVMTFLYGPFYVRGAVVLAILSAGRLLSVWTGSCGVTLMMTGHQKPMMYITIFSGVCSVVSGVLVAPHFGRVGVAVTTASAQVLQNGLQLVLARRLVGVWTHVQFAPRPLFQFLFGKRPLAAEA